MRFGSTLFRRIGATLAAIALTSMSFAPCAAFAASDTTGLASEKVETVNVSTSPTGSVENVEVATILKNDSSTAVLIDQSMLSSIEPDDDASYTASGIDLQWTTKGKDISYKGTTDKALPLTIEATYYLDGAVVDPRDLVGKSGEITIRYEYRNNDEFQASINGASENMFIPFTCITALMFDDKHFSNIKVTNGKTVVDGSNTIVAGYAMPGLKQSLGTVASDADIPDFFEVSATARDFELKSAMTIATAGLLSDVNVDSLGFGNTEGASEGLNDAMNQLIAGSSELSDGLSDLADGAHELSNGAYELSDGAKVLSYGLYQLAYGTADTPGLGDLQEGATGLVAAIDKIDGACATIADGKKGLPSVANALASITSSYPTEDEAALLVAAITASDMPDEAKASLSALVSSTPLVKDISEGVSAYSDGVTELSASISALAKESKALPEGAAAATAAAQMLYVGSLDVSEGANALSFATDELSSGMQSAAEGSDKLTEGLNSFESEGIAKVVDVIDNDLGGFKNRLSALSDAASSYDNFAGKAPGTPSSVKFVFESTPLTNE